MIQSFEPGEDWFWGFRSEVIIAGPELAEPRCHPDDQPAPGPADRVPVNGNELLNDGITADDGPSTRPVATAWRATMKTKTNRKQAER